MLNYNMCSDIISILLLVTNLVLMHVKCDCTMPWGQCTDTIRLRVSAWRVKWDSGKELLLGHWGDEPPSALCQWQCTARPDAQQLYSA